jgi:hypothetical protein
MNNGPAFYPFVAPSPNMVVQSGTTVVIKDLQSEEGRRLNGRKGTALRFFHQDGRWSVKLDASEGEGEDENGVVKKIRIQNLECRDSFCTCFDTERRTELVLAGMCNGSLAIYVFDDPNRPGFDPEPIKKQFLLMGVNPKCLDDVLKVFKEKCL